MGKFHRAVLALSLVLAWPLCALAQAQPAAAASAAKAEAAAAMERAQRLASNPMRVILEASKIRRKAPLEAAPEAADASSLRRTAASTAAPDAAPAPAREEAVITPRSVPAPRSAAADTLDTLLTTSSALNTAGPQAVQALERSAAVAPGLAVAKSSAAAVAVLLPVVETPRLDQSVDPVFPSRLQQEAQRLTEVSADLALRADGSVASVSLVSVVPRPLQQHIVAALAQWRFAPLSASQVHRVQLVFRAE